MIDSRHSPTSSLRKQGPIRCALSIGCGVWVPALRPVRRAGAIFAAAVALTVSAQPSAAAGVEDFYKGRNVAVIIGYSVGGGYDTYARLLARFLGEHIPGRPTMVQQNRPGAGSIKAAN